MAVDYKGEKVMARGYEEHKKTSYDIYCEDLEQLYRFYQCNLISIDDLVELASLRHIDRGVSLESLLKSYGYSLEKMRADGL